MADLNYDPNARYDSGPNAAGCGRVSNQDVLQAGALGVTGMAFDSTIAGAELRAGFNAEGIPHISYRGQSNTGPNVAGAPRSVNGT